MKTLRIKRQGQRYTLLAQVTQESCSGCNCITEIRLQEAQIASLHQWIFSLHMFQPLLLQSLKY